MANSFRLAAASSVGAAAADVADPTSAALSGPSHDAPVVQRDYTGNTAAHLPGRVRLNGGAGTPPAGETYTVALPNPAGGEVTAIGSYDFVFFGDFLVEIAPVSAPTVFVFAARAKGSTTAPVRWCSCGASTTAADANNPTTEKIGAIRVTSRAAAGTFATFVFDVQGE